MSGTRAPSSRFSPKPSRRWLWLALPFVPLAGCQLIAGTGDLKAHGASHAGGGGASVGSHVGSTGGNGGAGGDGGNGGHGGTCVPTKLGPSCDYLRPFGATTSEITPSALAVAAEGTSYLGGRATGQTPFGPCSDTSGCGFVQAIEAQGKKGKAVAFGREGGVSLDDLVVLGPSAGSEVILVGTLSPETHLALSKTVDLFGSGTPLYVAAYAAGLESPLWVEGLHFTGQDSDSRAKIRVGASAVGTIVVAANVAASADFDFGGCNHTGGTPGEEIVIETFDPDGKCKPTPLVFGGLGDQTVSVLAVASDGGFLVAGGFEEQIVFSTGGPITNMFSNPAAFFAYFANGLADPVWTSSIASTNDASITGGALSKDGLRLALSGSYSGNLPEGLGEAAAVDTCLGTDGANRQGFVKSYTNVSSGAPTLELELCLGESGDTRIDDVAIDGDGAVVLVGETSGAVKYGKFEVGGAGGLTAGFILKIDGQGKLVWGTRQDAAPSAMLFHARALDAGFLASGTFSGKIDLGCGCDATAITQHDVFLTRLGP